MKGNHSERLFLEDCTAHSQINEIVKSLRVLGLEKKVLSWKSNRRELFQIKQPAKLLNIKPNGEVSLLGAQ